MGGGGLLPRWLQGRLCGGDRSGGGGAAVRGGRQRAVDPVLGDVVIAYETSAYEAVVQGKPLKNHVSHLAVHGFLHLLGYDHERKGEAEEMEGLERAILFALGVPDPFA